MFRVMLFAPLFIVLEYVKCHESNLSALNLKALALELETIIGQVAPMTGDDRKKRDTNDKAGNDNTRIINDNDKNKENIQYPDKLMNLGGLFDMTSVRDKYFDGLESGRKMPQFVQNDMKYIESIFPINITKDHLPHPDELAKEIKHDDLKDYDQVLRKSGLRKRRSLNVRSRDEHQPKIPIHIRVEKVLEDLKADTRRKMDEDERKGDRKRYGLPNLDIFPRELVNEYMKHLIEIPELDYLMKDMPSSEGPVLRKINEQQSGVTEDIKSENLTPKIIKKNVGSRWSLPSMGQSNAGALNNDAVKA